jgi:hypothetical protein
MSGEVYHQMTMGGFSSERTYIFQTRVLHSCVDCQSVSQSVSPGVEPHLGLMIRYLLLFDSYCLVFLGRPL